MADSETDTTEPPNTFVVPSQTSTSSPKDGVRPVMSFAWNCAVSTVAPMFRSTTSEPHLTFEVTSTDSILTVTAILERQLDVIG